MIPNLVPHHGIVGRQKNVAQWLGHPNFQLIIHDVINPIMLEVDQVLHEPMHHHLGYSGEVATAMPVDLSLSLPSIPTALPIQPDQDHQDEH